MRNGPATGIPVPASGSCAVPARFRTCSSARLGPAEVPSRVANREVLAPTVKPAETAAG